MCTKIACSLVALASVLGAAAHAWAAPPAYADRAPIEQYRIASQADDIALARSAAPASISS
jgi:hypothetical protein